MADEAFLHRFIEGRPPADELERVLRVLAAAFGRWPERQPPHGALEHLGWKLEGPEGRPTRTYLTEAASGELVGVALRLRRRILLDGTIRDCFGDADAAIHPSAQGTGVYRSRSAFARQHDLHEFDVGVGTTTNPRVLRVHRDLHVPKNALQVLVRPLRPLAIAREALGAHRQVAAAAALSAAWAAGRARAVMRPRSHGGTEFRVGTVERLDAFYRQASARFSFVQLHDRDSLNWRYADARGGDYQLWVAEQPSASGSSGLAGICVTGRTGARGVVTELLALPGRNDAAAALLRSAVAGLAESGVAVATTWLPRRHPYASLFRDEAFVPVPRRRTGFVARAVRLRDRELRILDSARCPLHVTRGDADDI